MTKWILPLIIAVFINPAMAQSKDLDVEALTARAEAGELEAQRRLAAYYTSGGQSLNDMRQAARWLRLAAEQGDAKSQTEWANFLRTGRGDVEKNLKESASWLKRAAEQNHGPAQVNLAWHYRHGLGVDRDHKRAAHWYERGLAKTGWNRSPDFYYLGELYRSGTGVSKNFSLALDWFERAAENDHPPALFQLGLMHQHGESVPVNPAKAADYFRAVGSGTYDITGQDANIRINGGSVEAAAKSRLGYLYFQGEGIPQNKATASALFSDAAKGGNYIAQYNLGKLYYYGEGVKKDIEAARKWLSQAANQGYEPAQINLGHFYNNGHEVPRDIDKALHWYSKAAEQGSPEGAKQVAQIRKEIQPAVAAIKTQPPPQPPRKQPTQQYSLANEVTAEDVLGGIAVIAGLAILADAMSGDDPSTNSQANNRPINQYVQQCRDDVYRRLYRCYTHGSVCDVVGCVYEWNCQTPPGGRGECRRYTGYSDDIEDIFCDPKVGEGFRTEEEVMAHSCR